MKIWLLDIAELELDEAVAWYRGKGADVVSRFLAEVATGRERILTHPNAWHPMGDGVRRYRLDRFPYGIIYVVEKDEIIVLAVAHLHRHPDYWRERIASRQ